MTIATYKEGGEVKVGDKVQFYPGPASRQEIGGVVEKIERTGEGRGAATWCHVRSDDGVRKMRGGSLTKVP